MDAQLKPIANASDAVFLPVFDQLNQYAQEAWIEMYKQSQRGFMRHFVSFARIDDNPRGVIEPDAQLCASGDKYWTYI